MPDRLTASRIRGAVCLTGLALASCVYVSAQAVTFSPDETIDRRYSQITTTNVELPKQEIDARGHQEILRNLIAEQGFAMRPLPRGKKGLSLAANGKLTPSGEPYLKLVTDQGLSVKPGERVVLSNIRIDRDRIVFDLNGGPEHKHEFLRHIQIGVGGPGRTAPITQDNGQDPTGARVTLTFSGHTPDVSSAQIKALLAPLISFDVKTPVQAFTDTLPPKLKEAILNHHVMVGMSTQMVLFTLGQPESKSRETEGQMPFEEWIYGHPPQDVSFVRINGNRVIQVEFAKLGQPLQVFTKDEVGDMMQTGSSRPAYAEAAPHDSHTIQLGDVHRDPDKQSPTAPPSLRNPGEKLPQDDASAADPGARQGPMKPVIFPKNTPKDSGSVAPHPKPEAPTDPAAEPATGVGGGDSPKTTSPPAPDNGPAPGTASPATPPTH